ncbi:hypothetical protein K491DRAFT_636781 [Lophiostoma macrostomum CBS 122681]|uniref:BRCT domain-containing protein n=1 Tax=Lophiostoma macrostomum CBS 122681 TaxID=1314788 RepID=A0A6A6SVY0_9PLEO|nr:hypothetical protein K491DRAFT_636781 [Lophiostoma macrostomum CBS 122681]
MADTESQQCTLLQDEVYDDPSQLSQLLRQRAGSRDYSIHFTTSTEHRVSSGDTAGVAAESSSSRSAPPQVSVVQPSLDVNPRRASNHPEYVKPSLPKHLSAPISTGLVMERVAIERMHKSMGEVMDGPGDTQPDSQIYKAWTSGLLGNGSYGAGDNHARSLLSQLEEVQHVEEDVDTPTDGVEIVGSSLEEPHSPTVTSPTVLHDDDPETQLQTDAPFTSPFKFETPALAGRKRDNQGQVLSSGLRTATTPGTALTASAFPFAGLGNSGMGNNMSLTQIFHATQAGTSPIVGAASEDAVFQRPSPNFTNARPSSPIAVMSSPIKAVRTDPPLRSSSEPRAEYVTMRQSQDRRSPEIEHEQSMDPLQDSWDEPPSSIVKRAEARRRRELFDEEAKKRLSKVTAPSLSPQSPRRRKERTLKSLSTAHNMQIPSKTKASKRLFTYDGPYDEGEDRDQGEVAQHVSVNDNAHSDSPDELPQAVSVSAQPEPVIAKAKAQDKIQVPNTSSHPHRTLSGRLVRNSPPASPSALSDRASQTHFPGSQAFRRANQLKGSKETVAIMDSQPDVEDADTAPRPRSLLPSSPSINQYSINQTTMGGKTGFTSQIVSSSMPPMPPQSSSQGSGREVQPEGAEERVPSSPPALNGREAELEYDEHDYEEHISARADEEDLDRVPSVEKDVDMDREEAVPESEHADHDEGSQRDVLTANEVDQGDVKAEGTKHREEESQLQGGDDLARSGYLLEEEESSEQPLRPQHRGQRQSTIPESDIMEDTQPSMFAQTVPIGTNKAESAVGEGGPPPRTHSTEPFHTAREHQSASQSNTASITVSKTPDRSPRSSAPQFRSLIDIANQPQTQNSTDIGDIEMPRLSFTEEVSEDPVAKVSASSPIRPAIKKRKITTYGAKRKAPMSPAKVAEAKPSRFSPSPLKRVRHMTPSSTAEREDQGARAATHAREDVVSTRTVTRKFAATVVSRSTKPERKGALKPVDRSLLHKSPVSARSPRLLSSTKPATEPLTSDQAELSDTDMEDDSIAVRKPTSGQDGSPEAAESTGTDHDPSDRGEAPAGPAIVPNRVFAFWPGLNYYYPATCLDQSVDGSFKIRYDDGTETVKDANHVRALDLAVGDHVKVDEKGKKKNIYVVVGLKDKIDTEHDEPFPLTDRRGYATVVLEVKQRESLPKASSDQPQELISVALANIYLTPQLWTKLRDRVFDFTSTTLGSESASRVATPAVAASALGTPTARQRGARASLLQGSIRAGSVASSARVGGTVFANMAFAITMDPNSSDSLRDSIMQLVTSNGGQVLENGFHEFFTDMDGSEDGSTSATASKGKGKATAGSGDSLSIKHEYKDLAFVALISDSFCRRSKYIQALALNIPAIHHRWLVDSIASAAPLPFANYLLPAGASTYLDPRGIVRSRTMILYTPGAEGFSFQDIVADRDLLLDDQSVLLVTGKNKSEKEQKKPFVFLARALGCKVVGRCVDLAAAKDMVQDGTWDRVYVNDGGKAPAQTVKRIEEAANVLFGTPIPSSSSAKPRQTGRKRKRAESEDTEGDAGSGNNKGKNMVLAGDVDGKKVRVASDEFIVQSLILGALLDE